MKQITPQEIYELSKEEINVVAGGAVGHISNDKLKVLMGAALSLGATTVAALVPIVSAEISAIAATIAATVPGLGWVTGGAIAMCAGDHAFKIAQALIEGRGVDINLAFPCGISFSAADD